MQVIEQNTQTQEQQNYKVNNFLQSYYSNIKISPQQNSNVQIGTTQQQILFQIPQAVYNLQKASLEFTISYQSLGDIAADQRLFMCAWYPVFLNQVQLYSQTNSLNLVNIQQADLYSKMAQGFNLDASKQKQNAFTINKNSARGFQTTYALPYNGQQTDVVGNNKYLNDPYTDLMNLKAATQRLLITENINEIQQFYVNYSGTAGTTNKIYNKKFIMKLSDILPDTIFNIDKDLLIQPLYLKITLNTLNDCKLFSCNVQTANPDGFTAVTGTLNLQNIVLNMYQQKSPELLAGIIQDAKQQKILNIPVIQYNQINLGNSQQQTSSFKLSANQNSQKLYRAYYAVQSQDALTFNYNQTLNTSNLQYIIDGALEAGAQIVSPLSKYQQLQLYINSQLVYQMDCQADEDYDYCKQTHTNIVSLSQFRNSGAIDFVFSSQKIEDNNQIYNNNKLEGIDFDTNNGLQLNVNIQNTNQLNLIHHMYAVVIQQFYYYNGLFSYTSLVA